MTKSICSIEFEKICDILDRLSHDVEKMASKTYEGLLRHKRQLLEEAETAGNGVLQGAKELTQTVLTAKDFPAPDSAMIVAVSNEMQKIKYSLDKIISSVGTKIDEGVLFSDRAVTELKDFYTTVLDGLKHVHDLLLTRNPVLVNHVIQKAEAYEEVAVKYAEEHQDRLIKGICLPKSSLIYLLILDSLKDILWYIKSIAVLFRKEE